MRAGGTAEPLEFTHAGVGGRPGVRGAGARGAGARGEHAGPAQATALECRRRIGSASRAARDLEISVACVGLECRAPLPALFEDRAQKFREGAACRVNR